MGIETDLNVNPYFDDYDENKDFHRVLFKPAVPLQARELTTLQTILQNQIEKFGQFTFKEGSIVKGCAFTFDRNIKYAKNWSENTSEVVKINIGRFSYWQISHFPCQHPFFSKLHSAVESCSEVICQC